MKEILKLIKKYNTIIIHGHQNPDGDCLGSQIGLKDIIKTTFPKKEVYVVGENSEYVSFIGNVDTISDDKFKGALSIIVDLANAERCSDDRYKLADFSIKIDHHIFVEKYADYEYIEEGCSSCSEIICALYKKFRLKMTLKGACALYTGIITDTGRFRFDSIKKRTFEMAGMLIDMGVNPQDIDNALSQDTVDTLKLRGYVLSNFLMPQDNVAVIKMTRDIIDKYNVSDEDAANMVNSVSSIKGLSVWALIIEYKSGVIKVRLRSKGPDVNLLAMKYNGGGHKKASGCKLQSWDEVPKFVQDLCEIAK